MAANPAPATAILAAVFMRFSLDVNHAAKYNIWQLEIAPSCFHSIA
jgi:hypothetical protein